MAYPGRTISALLQARDGPQHLQLDIAGQARRDAVGVIFGCLQPLGLQEHLVPLLLREADDLVLDGWAVPRADSPDDARVQGGAGKPRTDRLVGRRIGVRQETGDLLATYLLGIKGERNRLGIPVLAGRLREIDGFPVEPRRGAGLEAAHREPQPPQRVRKAHGGEFPRPPGGVAHQPHVDQPLEEGPGGEHHRLAPVADVDVRIDPHRRVPFRDDRVDDRLLHVEALRRLQRLLQPEAVQLLVGLGPRRADGRPLAGVQLPELDPGGVDVARHLAAQGVDLPDEVPLRQPPDRGIARHQADGVRIDGEEEGGAAHPGRGERRLAAGMAAADNDDVVFLRIFVRRSAHSRP